MQLHEFVEWLLSSLSEHDQQIVKDRISGHGWKELAETDKSPPDALRKRIGRALRRVANDKALDG